MLAKLVSKHLVLKNKLFRKHAIKLCNLKTSYNQNVIMQLFINFEKMYKSYLSAKFKVFCY